MSRVKIALAATGIAVVTAAAGYAAGLLAAPASGREMRRRLAWRTEDQWRTMARASERLLARAADRAAAELDARRKRVGEAVAAHFR